MRPLIVVLIVLALIGLLAFLLWSPDEAGTRRELPVGDGASRRSGARADEERGTGGAELATRTFPEEVAPGTATGETPAAGRAMRVHGRVLDGRRRGRPDVRVVARLEGLSPVETVTAADGTFELEVGPLSRGGWKLGCLEAASAATQEATWQELHLPLDGRNRFELEPIQLGEAYAVDIEVRERGREVPGAIVYLHLPAGIDHGPLQSDEKGQLHGMLLGPGAYDVIAFSEAGDRGQRRIEVPMPAGTRAVVALEPGRRLRVLVRDEATGAPVTGATLSAFVTERLPDGGLLVGPPRLPWPAPVTGRDGYAALKGLPPGAEVEIFARRLELAKADGIELRDGTRALARADDEEIVIDFVAGTRIVFPIAGTEGEPLPEGAVIALRRAEGFLGAGPPPCGRIERSALVVDGVARSCSAMIGEAPDGSLALLGILEGQGQPARFTRPRSLVASVRDTTGAPVTGAWIEVREPGLPLVSPVPLDANGSARVEQLLPMEASVFLSPSARPLGPSRELGRVDLRSSIDARLDAVVEPERRFLVRVTVNGERRLPSRFSLDVEGGVCGRIAEDPEAGELSFRWRPTGARSETRITLNASGCPPSSAEVDLDLSGEDIVVDLPLQEGNLLEVVVHRPADGLLELRLQHWDEEHRMWSDRPVPPPLPERSLVLRGLGRGRYRVGDILSGATSEPVDVGAGARAGLTLDLARAGWVRGNVVGPSGESVDGAEVQARLDGADLRRGDERWQHVDPTGRFSRRIPGDRPVTLAVRHPILRPHPEHGHAIVSLPREGIELHLVHGPTATFSMAPALAAQLEAGPRALLFRGAITATPSRTCDVRHQGGRGEFGGFDPGRYSVVIDLPPMAPLVWKDVELGSDTTDLGPAALSRGSVVRVTVVAPPATPLPPIAITARALDPPRYERFAIVPGAPAVELSGLGPGRFEIGLRPDLPGAVQRHHTVVSDGASPIPLVLDLR